MLTCVTMPAAAVTLLGAVRAGAPRAVTDRTDPGFVPHVLAVPVGTSVDLPNGDPMFHDVATALAAEPFDLGLRLRRVW
jgi:hypothetical protein